MSGDRKGWDLDYLAGEDGWCHSSSCDESLTVVDSAHCWQNGHLQKWLNRGNASVRRTWGELSIGCHFKNYPQPYTK